MFEKRSEEEEEMKKRNIFLGKRHHEICGVDKKDIKHLGGRLDSEGGDGMEISLSLARRLTTERGKWNDTANPDRHAIAFTCYSSPSRS